VPSRHVLLSLVFVFLLPGALRADEVALIYGQGPQAGSQQRNRVLGLEYAFYTFERSDRQHLQVGVAYTRLRTNAASFNEMYVVSVFPQLTFYPPATGSLALSMPQGLQQFFYALILGPAYISATALGERRQARHFAFHAQIGTGVVFESRRGHKLIAHVSWRHLSNANLDSPNDGIDVPLVLTFGIRY